MAGSEALGDEAASPPPPPRSLRTALRRTPVSMWDDDVSDWAAALTYYAILALLPALLVTVSLIGLVSPSATDGLIEHITAWAPAQAGESLHQALRDMADQRSAALTVVVAGGVSALWSASSYLAVFRRALHAMYAVEDRRPMLRKAHKIVLTALAALGLLVASALVLTLSGPLAQTLSRSLGLGSTGALVWEAAKWPALLCLVTLLVLLVSRTGPATSLPRRYRLAGGGLAAIMWLVASLGFTVYASLSTYSQLYGSLAGLVVFLIWLWVSNLSLLAGAQFTAELTKPDPEQSPAPDTVHPPSAPPTPCGPDTPTAPEPNAPGPGAGPGNSTGTPAAPHNSPSAPATPARAPAPAPAPARTGTGTVGGRRGAT